MNDDQVVEMLKQLAVNEQEHNSFRRRLDDHDKLLEGQNMAIGLIGYGISLLVNSPALPTP